MFCENNDLWNGTSKLLAQIKIMTCLNFTSKFFFHVSNFRYAFIIRHVRKVTSTMDIFSNHFIYFVVRLFVFKNQRRPSFIIRHSTANLLSENTCFLVIHSGKNWLSVQQQKNFFFLNSHTYFLEWSVKTVLLVLKWKNFFVHFLRTIFLVWKAWIALIYF